MRSLTTRRPCRATAAGACQALLVLCAGILTPGLAARASVVTFARASTSANGCNDIDSQDSVGGGPNIKANAAALAGALDCDGFFVNAFANSQVNPRTGSIDVHADAQSNDPGSATARADGGITAEFRIKGRPGGGQSSTYTIQVSGTTTGD